MVLPLSRALGLLQRYPGAFLLPVVVIAGAHLGIDHAIASAPVSKFLQFLLMIVGLLVNFCLASVVFLCVATYTVRSESNGEQPKPGNVLDALKCPGCAPLLSGMLTRFALTLVASGAVTLIVVVPALEALKAATHHAVRREISGEAYLWVATIVGVAILSRWALAIPLFAQSQGLLKTPFSTSAKAIRGLRTFVIVFTLLIQAACYPLIRLTMPHHLHLSQGTARYVPLLLETLAARGLQAVLWTWWMIVMTMLAMRLQGTDEPVPAAPLAVA
ncbi:MAG TPA: hypothetical protein VMB19_07915 [Silvibacterium sp.]|nr:hypothetical protein [Silvibacterium sp.]